MNGPLLRPRYGKKIAGVCAAFARAYGWDVTLVRIAVLVLALTTGFGFIAYVVCWVAIPEEPLYLPQGTGAYTASQAYPPAQPPAYPPSEPPAV